MVEIRKKRGGMEQRGCQALTREKNGGTRISRYIPINKTEGGRHGVNEKASVHDTAERPQPVKDEVEKGAGETVTVNLELEQVAPEGKPSGQEDAKPEPASSFKLLWTFRTGSFIDSSPSAAEDGMVYVASRDHRLYAVKEGKSIWEYDSGGQIHSTPCVNPDGVVFAGGNDGRIHAVKMGKRVGEYTAGEAIFSSPRRGPGHIVYVGSCDGRLYALMKGKKVASYPMGAQVFSSPCIGPDGTIYVGCDDHRLYALAPPELPWRAFEHQEVEPAGTMSSRRHTTSLLL